MKKPIAISLSPNTQKDDVFLALKNLFSPIKWYDVAMTRKLEEMMSKRLGKQFRSLAVNSGRSALYLLLKSLNIKRGDEVAIQALTCVAVPNAVLWLGATPVYVDVDDTFNMDAADLAKKISKKTKVVILQHSFGVPANIEKIQKVLKNKKVYLIEDCAISMGAKYKGRQVGSFGDASFFSFGRDKVVSSVFGGLMATNNKQIYDAFLMERDKIVFPLPPWTVQQLLHPILFSIILPLYNVGYKKYTLGKLMLVFFQTLNILSKPVYKMEEENRRPEVFPKKLPGSLAGLAVNQLNKLDEFNNHRIKITEHYFKNLKNSDNFVLPRKANGAIWLRYTVVAQDADKLYEFAKKKGILLGNWYKEVVYKTKSLAAIGYFKGSCPKAESYKGSMINLPTYPNLTLKQADEVIKTIKQWTDIK